MPTLTRLGAAFGHARVLLLGALILTGTGAAASSSRAVGAAPAGVIVFTSDRDGPGATSVYAVRPDGTQLERVAADAAEARVSPDGTRVVVSPEGAETLRVIDLTTGKRLALLDGFIFGWALNERVWAPDSSRFVAGAEDGLWTFNEDGKGGKQVTHGTEDGEPAWSPDSRSIAFTTARALYVVKADGTGLRQVTTKEAGQPDWSPDGRRIAFIRSQRDGSYATFVVPASGGAETRIGPGFPAWSPDGRTLALADEELGLALYTPNGKLERALLKGQGAGSASWSPDGRSVLAVADGDLRLFARDGRTTTVVTQGARYGYTGFDPSWSRTAPATLSGTPVTAAVPFTGPLIGISGTTGRMIAFPNVSARPGRAVPYPQPATVDAVAADGSGGWYIGGDFRSIGNVECANLAHVKSDRTVDRRWCPRPDQPVHALLLLGTTLFVGMEGTSRIGTATRAGIAAFDARTGKLAEWNPRVVGEVDGLASDPGKRTLYFRGAFDKVGGVHRSNLAAVDLRTARPTAFAPNPDTNMHGDGIYGLAVTATRIYTWGAYEHIGGKVARGDPVTLDPRSGTVAQWYKPVLDGGVQGIAVRDDRVFVGGIFTRIGGVHRDDLASFTGATAAVDPWSPITGQRLSVEQVAVANSTVYAALVNEQLVGSVGQGARSIVAYDATTAKQVWRARVRPMNRIDVIAGAGGLVVVGGVFRAVA
jgi:hypothetical protein